VRALIVDDNFTNQRVLQEMILGWGSTAVVADGAEQGLVLMRLAVTQGRPFDVLLLDLNMPDIDGYGLARMVCADPSLAHTPMVMLTSSAQRGEAERTRRAGIVAYLTKPVRSARLRGALNLALGPTADPPRVTSVTLPDPDDGVSVLTNGNAVLTNGDAELTNGAGWEFSEPRHAGPDPHSPGSAAGSVLVVEDNRTNQKVLTALLASLGYHADVAANGVDAVEAVRLHDYAVVLMDCQMPVMDGYEATEKLREIEGADRHTCVIAVTATAMAADRDRCLAAGMDDYLAKPLSLDSLAAVLAHWAPDHSDANVAAARAQSALEPNFGPTQPDPRDDIAGDALAAVGAPVLDAQVIARLERLGADAGEDLMEQLSALFLADADMGVVVMRDALAGDDAATLARAAHTLRGASANVGANALAALCAVLEADSTCGNLAAGPAHLAALETELGRVRSALSSRTARR
jgi:two-component system, sensor histidine kinase and response regulator